MEMDERHRLDEEAESFKRLLVASDPDRWIPKLYPQWVTTPAKAKEEDDLSDLVDQEGNLNLDNVTLKYTEVPTPQEVNETLEQVRHLLNDRTGVINGTDGIDPNGWT